MHLGWHVGAGILVGGVVSVVFEDFGGPGWFGMMMGMVGIDLIDHGLWILAKIRPLTIKNIWRVEIGLYKRMEGQFYFFHTIEVYILAIILVSGFSWGGWFMLAYTLHLMMDGYKYLSNRADLEWLKKWSMIWWMSRMVKSWNG